MNPSLFLLLACIFFSYKAWQNCKENLVLFWHSDEEKIFALIFSSNPIVRIDVFLIASIVISYAKARETTTQNWLLYSFSVFAGFSAHIFTPILTALSTPDKDSRLSVISSRHHGKDLFAKLQICWLLLIFTLVNISILHIFILA